MAAITYTNQRGVNAPLYVFLDAVVDLQNTAWGPNSYTITYRSLNTEDPFGASYGSLNGYTFTLEGSGFEYENGVPTAGTITSILVRDASGNVIVTATGLDGTGNLLKAFYDTLQNTGDPEATVARLLLSDAVVHTGSTSIDHLLDIGAGSTVDGLGGDDLIWGRSSNLKLIGGFGSDTLILGNRSGFSNVTVHGGTEDGSGNPADYDVLSIRQDASFAGIFGIDRLEFVGPDAATEIRMTIGTDMVGPDKLSSVLTLQTKANTNAVLAFNRTGSGPLKLDLSGWEINKLPGSTLKVEMDFTVGDTGQADSIYGSPADDVISAGAGDDTIIGSNGNDSLYGGAGNDSLFSAGSPRAGTPEIINGGEGTDFASIVRWNQTKAFEFTVSPSGTQILSDTTEIVSIERVEFMGGSGNDKLTGGALADTLEGYLGSDTLDGGGGDDELYGGGGIDSLIGGTGNDTFLIRDAGDAIVEVAGQGTDTVLTTLDFSLATLGAVENLKAEKAEDSAAISLTGNALANTLVGNAGRNILKGSAGNDRLEGLVGDDLLYGGTGKDTLIGGAGNDSFVFDTRPNKTTNVDTILGFSSQDDTIRLENAIFKGLKKTGTLSKSAFVLGTKAKDANDRILYDKKRGDVLYDADGTGKTAAVKIIKIIDKATLKHADFFVI